MQKPPNYQTTSSQQKLNQGPRDMPDRGGKKPEAQISGASSLPLSRTAHPVANLENKARMGTVDCNSTKMSLSRAATSPYDELNATMPQVPFSKGRGRKR